MDYSVFLDEAETSDNPKISINLILGSCNMFLNIYMLLVRLETAGLKLKYLSDFFPCSSHTQKQ